jgi:deoxyribodipyrimidine photo-lyase
MAVASLRIDVANQAPVKSSGKYVLYWMIANRRVEWNFALDRAVELSSELQRPILIFEALRVGYRWACDRLHAFVAAGMRNNEAQCRHAGVAYFPYLEPAPRAAEGLLEQLADDACVVVTDEFPCFFLPHMVGLVARRLSVRLEVVDSNGLLPLRAAGKAYARAFDFRRFLQRSLKPHLDEQPKPAPLNDYNQGLATVPKVVRDRWPAADLASADEQIQSFPIDHSIRTGTVVGGSEAGQQQLKRFLRDGLARYATERSDPDADAASGLSPYLHFGHVSAHQVFAAVARHEHWRTKDISGHATGSNRDWWGGSPALEAFFDELITWRELGYNFCHHRRDYDRFESLPAWAKATLKKHERDPRSTTYSLEQLAAADTYDEVWNASQRQLVGEGRIQNYLRMLWGKKILEWSPNAQTALRNLIELNNRYALDGRNPNSYSGIFWVLGRFDRAWGPERPIFGTIRYMSSESARRKLRMKQYLARWSP